MKGKRTHLQLVTAPSTPSSRQSLQIAFAEDEQDELSLLDAKINSPAPVALQLPKTFDHKNVIRVAPANLGFTEVSFFDHPETGLPYLRLTNPYDAELTEDQHLTEIFYCINGIHLGLLELYSDNFLSTVIDRAPWSFSSGHSQNQTEALVSARANSPRTLIDQLQMKINSLLHIGKK